ncbi:ABC transporter permease [Desulfococcaceae bacterium HSG9]|nr:ABC transporter permease [Desulfococcaceae bacterium HSG9]
MLLYLFKKLLTLFLLLFLVSIIIFSVLYILPGDPAQIILGINATPETLANLRAQLGIDRPFVVQYSEWIYHTLSGQGSISINYDIPVHQLILSRLTVTAPLALMAIIVSLIIALPAGINAACRQNRPGDLIIMFGAQIGLAIPEFWLGLLFILLFAVQFGWFAAGGFPGWSVDFMGSLKALILPACALGLIRASILTRLTRTSMLEVLQEDYIRTARAKGVSEKKVIYGHALRNALIPILTILGLQLGQLIAGAIIIENVFYLPGLGRLVFQAIGQRDLPVVRDIVLFMAAAVVIVNFLVDIVYAVIDPRLRLS